MGQPKFLKYLWQNWKGILLWGFILGLLFMLVVFVWLGGQSFFELEGFSRRSLLANMALYIVIFLVVGIFQAILSSYFYFYFMMGGGMSKMLGDTSAEKTKAD